MATLIQAVNLHKTFEIGREKLTVLGGCSLAAKQGEFVAIMGASGSGKSTLLHILGLLDRPDRGKVEIDGQDAFALSSGKQDRLRNQDIGFVFQFYHLLPELTLVENIMLPAMVGTSLLGWGSQKRTVLQRAGELMEQVGLADRAKQWPATLSGGERQRTAIARALMSRPRLLLADEPTGNLDATSGKAILDILLRLNRDGQTIILVTHDAAVAALAHRQLELIGGQLREMNDDALAAGQ